MISGVKKEIIVTVCCSIIVCITSIIAAYIASQKVTRYELLRVPSFDLITTTDYFPLKEGDEWTYEGVAENATEEGRVAKAKVVIKMRVVKSVKGKCATLYEMAGHPSDCAWALSDDDSKKTSVDIKPSKYGYLVVGNKIFHVDEDKLSAIAKALITNGLLEEGVLSEDDIAFEFPLFKGQIYGAISQLVRDDRSYVWYVNNSTLYHEQEGDKIKEMPEYQLIYNTRPDYMEINFIPYLGIVSCSYSHHGTKAQINVSLVKYHVHTEK